MQLLTELKPTIIFIYSNSKFEVTCKSTDFECLFTRTHTKEKPSKNFKHYIWHFALSEKILKTVPIVAASNHNLKTLSDVSFILDGTTIFPSSVIRNLGDTLESDMSMICCYHLQLYTLPPL